MPPARQARVPSPTSLKPALQEYRMTLPNWKVVPIGVLTPFEGVLGFVQVSTAKQKNGGLVKAAFFS